MKKFILLISSIYTCNITCMNITFNITINGQDSQHVLNIQRKQNVEIDQIHNQTQQPESESVTQSTEIEVLKEKIKELQQENVRLNGIVNYHNEIANQSIQFTTQSAETKIDLQHSKSQIHDGQLNHQIHQQQEEKNNLITTKSQEISDLKQQIKELTKK